MTRKHEQETNSDKQINKKLNEMKTDNKDQQVQQKVIVEEVKLMGWLWMSLEKTEVKAASLNWCLIKGTQLLACLETVNMM